MEIVRKLYPHLRPHLPRLALGMAGMAVFTVLSLLPPLLLRHLVNDVVQAETWQLLLPVILLIIAVPLLASLVQFGNTKIVMLSAFRFISDVRKEMYRRIFSLSMRFHQENSSGLLVNKLMDDVNMVQRLITGETVNMLVDFIVFVCSVAIVFALSPVISLVLVAILVLYAVAYRLFSKRIQVSTSSFRNIYDRISERLQETVAGVRRVRIYTKEGRENELFLDRTSMSLRHSQTGAVATVSLSTVCNLIAGFGSAVIACVGAYFVIRGRLRYGDVLSINSYIWMALNPAIRLTNLAGQLSEIFVSVRRVVQVLEEKPRITSKPGAPPMCRGTGRVEFRNVRFGYAPDLPLYRGLNLVVEPGETAALVGHTGCGKTTLTSLLMRYWDIQGGEILIDGVDIREVQVRSLRELFGVVLQDPVVFDGTVAQNIAYGMHDATEAEIVEAARAAEIHDMVMRLPDGFGTEIGTNGIKLSVGEKQRLSIARAIVKDPLILMMDEATSSLDSESEALIQRALGRVLSGRTSFVVAHRLSTIVNADKIVVMDNGAIVELGRHQDLMQIEGGTYRRLYEELAGSVHEVKR